MDHRRRYSPPVSPPAAIGGPSSIYSSTASMLAGGSYNRDNRDSPTAGSRTLSSPRRYQPTSICYPIPTSPPSTPEANEADEAYARVSRVSSTFRTGEVYRARSRSPTLTTTTTTIASAWKPNTNTTTSVWRPPTSYGSAAPSTSYRARPRPSDPELTYSIDQDPVVAAISQRLSRETSYGSPRAKVGPGATDGDDDPFKLPAHPTRHRFEQSIEKSDFFNYEEKRFLASVNKMVNCSDLDGRHYCQDVSAPRADPPKRCFGVPNGSLPRSNSFQDLRDQDPTRASPTGSSAILAGAARDRHRTLAYGVSAADLAMVVDPHVTTAKLESGGDLPDFKFGSRPSSDYEQAANVTIRGPSSANPLSGFKSDMSSGTDVAHESTSQSTGKCEDKGNHDKVKNGEVDYKKLWEDTQVENVKLRDDLRKIRKEMKAQMKKMESNQAVDSKKSSGLNEREKKEKVVLEKKLAEMEEELRLLALSENLTDQQLEHLKNDNQRLRNENEALIRVISKLSK